MNPLAALLLGSLAVPPSPSWDRRIDPPLSSVLVETRVEAIGESSPGPRPASHWRRGLLAASYAGLYGGATKVGSRLGLSPQFQIVRLESAYAYDLVSHVFNVHQLGQIMGSVHRAAGTEPGRARALGAWLGAFGPLTYMEVINGYMPGVRFDPLDPLANAVGAWLATGGHDLAQRHRWLRRFSLEFGYKSLRRLLGAPRSSGVMGNWWHDYPNGRFGLTYGLGPIEAPWLRVVASYEITSLELATLRNRFGLGLEIPAARWLLGWFGEVPLVRTLGAGYEWLDRRFLMPGLYFQLWTIDAGPFSGREPFVQ